MDTKLQIITVVGIAIMLMILFIATSYAKNDFKSDEEYCDDDSIYQDETSDYYEDNDEAEMLYEATSKSFKLNHMHRVLPHMILIRINNSRTTVFMWKTYTPR